MGSMSASDAAPLPRLGEVFFDVRGSSRSMRLSWYADTGISVFSIWQGGTCTGTFRLPQEELPRLIDALQRGMYPDPRGTGGFVRQFPGAPTDPRLTSLPGSAGVRDFGREADFTGPVTGDFRALRADDPAGTMVLGSSSPRALPPGSGYSDQPRYPEQAQYPEQASYPDPVPGREQGYAQPAQVQYLDQARYSTQPQYADQAYSAPGYQERYGAQGSYPSQAPQPGQRYDDHGYLPRTEQGYQGYGYDQHASAGPAYSGPGYQGQSYSGQEYDSGAYAGQGYDDRAYQQPGYRGRSYPEQGYAGYAERGSQSQYGYSGQGYREQGYASSGEAYPEPGYSSYESGGYPAGHDQGGYDRSGHESGGYGRPGYESGGYGNRGYDGNAGDGYGGAGYDDAGSGGPGYDRAGYGAGDRAQYDDPDVTPSQPMSSFPYDGGPPPDRGHRHRRRR